MQAANTPFLSQDVSADYPETTPAGEIALPPRDHIVLDCTVRGAAHESWFKAKLKFDVELVGAITAELVGVKHVLVRGSVTGEQAILYRVQHAEISSGDTLTANGHPDVVSGKNYLVFSVEEEADFNRATWRVKPAAVPGYYAVESLLNMLLGI